MATSYRPSPHAHVVVLSWLLECFVAQRLHGAGGHVPAHAGRGAELSRASCAASEAGNAVLCLLSVFTWVQPLRLHAIYAFPRAFFNLPLFLVMPAPWTAFQEFVGRSGTETLLEAHNQMAWLWQAGVGEGCVTTLPPHSARWPQGEGTPRAWEQRHLRECF